MSQPTAEPEQGFMGGGGREGGKEGGKKEEHTISISSSARMPYASDGLRVGLRHNSQRSVMGFPTRGKKAAVTVTSALPQQNRGQVHLLRATGKPDPERGYALIHPLSALLYRSSDHR